MASPQHKAGDGIAAPQPAPLRPRTSPRVVKHHTTKNGNNAYRFQHKRNSIAGTLSLFELLADPLEAGHRLLIFRFFNRRFMLMVMRLGVGIVLGVRVLLGLLFTPVRLGRDNVRSQKAKREAQHSHEKQRQGKIMTLRCSHKIGQQE